MDKVKWPEKAREKPQGKLETLGLEGTFGGGQTNRQTSEGKTRV